MRHGFYRRLAWTGICKNKKLYLPYILTCVVMVMMTYIISFLGTSEVVSGLKGGEMMQSFLLTGRVVIVFFSLIFLFYTHIFLMRGRKKEFGLYNILGMGKWNIGRVLVWENLIVAGITLAAGMALGILLSKIGELCMVNMLEGTVDFSMRISIDSLWKTASYFLAIYLVIFLNAIRQIHMSNPIELLRGGSVGEKPPKGNWFLALAGVIILAAAYYLAVSLEDPLTAMYMFFLAAAMVVAATYLLFIAGSVALCRILQKNPKYYYKTNHFVSVSSMAYRMKRNGAGLASICILCTMVLVMVSSTTCLYMGLEDTLRSRYPRQINVNINSAEMGVLSEAYQDALEEEIVAVSKEYGQEPEELLAYPMAASAGVIEGNHLIASGESLQELFQENITLSDIWQVFYISLQDYNRLMDTEETLGNDQVMIYLTKESSFDSNRISFDDGAEYEVKKQLDDFVDNGIDAMQVMPSIFVIVPELETFVEENGYVTDGTSSLQLGMTYEFDIQGDDEMQIRFYNELKERDLAGKIREKLGMASEAEIESRANDRMDFFGIYGGLFFLGILLGIVFLVAAVLIIYYKQISEGYEDKGRFDILQKVGMTKKEIRKSINSQILTVFFLPLLTAGVHLAFAFPLIRKVLLLFGMNHTAFLIAVTVGCYLIFAVFYAAVYKITSGSYFTIVSGGKN